jgi:signal transduction histidine kinase
MIWRIFLYLVLFHSSIYATHIEYVAITPDRADIDFQNIHELTSFQKTPLPVKLSTTQNYWIKLKLDEELLSSQTPYVLKVETEFGRYNVSTDPAYQKDILEPNVFHLQHSKSSTFYFKLNNITNSIRFDADVIDAQTYFKHKETKKILYGISYGIMISAILYYLAFFLFNRHKSYIYYSLTQFFMLSILMMVTHKSFNDQDELTFALFYTGFITFTSLFSSSFLQLQRYAPLWNKILFISTIILIIDAFSNIFTLLKIPIAQLMFIYIIIAIIVYYKTSKKYILFYISGWGILISSLVYLEIQSIFMAEFFLEPNYMLHIAMPLESLVLALALSYKMRLIENEKADKERMLVEYDKRASIGDMLDNIAHQWRQPLTSIGYLIMNVSGAIRNDKFDLNYWQKKEREINLQLEYMSQTITDFRDFYKPSNKRVEFNLYEAIEKTYTMVRSILSLHEIRFTLDGNKDIYIFGNESEFRQVILNLLHNAQEAFEKQNIKDKYIDISVEGTKVYVKDNAGGIDPEIKKALFLSYSSTKHPGRGRGLYMSKLIIEEHFKGTMQHKNDSAGSIFTIELSN